MTSIVTALTHVLDHLTPETWQQDQTYLQTLAMNAMTACGIRPYYDFRRQGVWECLGHAAVRVCGVEMFPDHLRYGTGALAVFNEHCSSVEFAQTMVGTAIEIAKGIQ